ncbi:hemolysin regulation protein AhpA [Mergibacter septicus]|uniref:Hemolysin regulation protein AhpA n=1 Tax=Mergibacter septicus TaxID=221402 RepID=A0A8E3ME87_9PAST|nr:YtjB family periplasmic protein [Mergibacter septicus]AWX15810.1 hemolysin regulation protein AhpA [Mergibacter septicus]QDJ13289.1 hemolysin regulation protein AhpA [Mergibacter septicus]QDJ15063.1 hemolysin regulation protein AhpA [Mergibacter septicus]UTU47513.1 hemolysin regulation protein AhpA [Mergibacter septicus]
MQFRKERKYKFCLLSIIIGLCVLILSIILIGVSQFKVGSQQASIEQVADLSHTLVRQQANLFSVLLLNKADNESLTENLSRFTQEKFIVDASLYNQNGELLAHSQHYLTQPHQEQQITQQVVEPIYSSSGLIGFLRVTFNGQFGQDANEILDRQFHRLYGQIIIVFLTGILFTSSLLYWKRKRRKTNIINTLNTRSTSHLKQTMPYHRRRRLYK